MLPIGSREKLETLRGEIDEAFRLAGEDDSLRVAHFPDVRPIVGKAAVVGSLLEAEDFLALAALLRAAAQARAALSVRADLPALSAHARALDALPSLSRRLDRTFDASGAVRDDATPELARIRREAERMRGDIRRQLERRMRALAADGVLQDEVVAIRSGRLVLPVMAHAKDRVPGIVHDESSTGATLFVEPMEAVPMNNRVTELAQEDAREVRALLAALTDDVRASLPAIASNFEILSALDATIAKALYARSVNGVFPAFSDAGELSLLEARHPLLLEQNPAATVPLTLALSGGTSTLLLSGPNTGGKTVALKTVGLLSLLAQCGVPIPAGRGTTFPIFAQVFAEIGDDQSIEENLSSYSARLRTVREVLRAAGASSLVLLDELGTGTDPEEGGALAGALLRALARRGARVVATTHLGFLMDLVAHEPGMMNASMAFDSASGRPTYRVMPGVPGKSHALEIARGLGVDEAVLEEAAALLTEGARRSRELVRELEERTLRSREREREIDGDRERAAARLHEVEERAAKLDLDEREQKRRAAESARAILRQAERQAEEIIGTLRKTVREIEAARIEPRAPERGAGDARADAELAAAAAADAATSAREAIQRLRDARRDVDRESPPVDPFSSRGGFPEDLRAGEKVAVAPHGRQGTVLSPRTSRVASRSWSGACGSRCRSPR